MANADKAATEGVLDSAVLLLTLGEEQAAEVFKFLSPKEVQKIGQTMATLKGITTDQVSNVLEKFHGEAAKHTGIDVESEEYVRSVLKKALGEDKAGVLIERIFSTGDTSGIDGLKWMDAASIAELIRGEHPQIIATILVHLEREQAAEVLNQFDDRLRSDAVLRIATLDRIDPDAFKQLNDVLAKLLSGRSSMKSAQLGGTKTAAEILNFVGAATENAVIEVVKEHDADLAQKILDQMFVFDDLIELDNQAIQLVLRETASEALVIALKGTSETLREKVFSNMSARAADMLKEDLESRGPVRLAEVELQQKEILKTIRRLAEEGQIALGGAGGEAFV